MADGEPVAAQRISLDQGTPRSWEEGAALWPRQPDMVVEGMAVKVHDENRLRRVADAYASKYGWHVRCAKAPFRTRRGRRPRVPLRTRSTR